MKGSRIFFVLMAVLLMAISAILLGMPKQFVWNPTFLHTDRQPFGCYVFDSVLVQSLPKGYHVTDKTLYQLEEESYDGKFAVLAVMDQMNIDKIEAEYAHRLAKRGCKVMIVSGMDAVADSLFDVSFLWRTDFKLARLRRLYNDTDLDTIRWMAYPAAYPHSEYRFNHTLMSSFLACDSAATGIDTVATAHLNQPVAMAQRYGKGEIIYVSMPLLFTNYGVLDRNTSPFLFRLLSLIADMPVYRTEAYMDNHEILGDTESLSPLREFIKRPALRWALYLALIGVVLFMIFTARRRQRVIPVMEPPKNRTLEFIQLIGTLYWQRDRRKKRNHTKTVETNIKSITQKIWKNKDWI